MVLLAASVFFLLAALWLLVSRRDPRLPPSPPAIPIIGHLHLLTNSPHQSLLELARKHGGLMYLRLGSVNILVASTPAAAKEVLGTRDRVFASRPLLSTAKYLDRYGLAWAPYGEHWREVRKLCTLEILTKRRIEMFKPLRRLEMTVVMDELLEACRRKRAVNLTALLTDFTFNTMMRVVLSKSFSGACKDPSAKQKAAEFGDTVTAGIALASGANIGEFIPWLKCFDRQIPKIKELQRKMDVYLDAELQEHKQKMSSTEVLVPKDFMDVMITAGVLDDNSIKALALDMIGAGKDTSALTVEWGLSELIKNPEVLAKLREEIDKVVEKGRTLEEDDIPRLPYLQAVVKETLRLHPSTPLLLPHESVEPCTIADLYAIPAKTRLIVNAYAIGRDPSVWNQPEQFDPGRFMPDGANSSIDVKGQDYELLPFGSGRRMCPGVTLGLTIVHFMLGSLVHSFEWRSPSSTEIDMKEAFGLSLPRASPLVVSELRPRT